MNGKGQFSIIAALLVAVVLVATVIMTYSMIRTGFVQVHPQILSTVEETHIALKEILGFTVGYYGSVLKVTGNSTYAKELAINYMKGGLERLAQTYPELGASFNLSSVDLNTYWYGRRSWSRGKLVLDYSLAGLGLYGMRYVTSCELEVQVVEISGNQTKLRVTKDGGEPQLSLTKQNFKFYRYNYENSTWMLISPSKDPSVDPYGVYTIDMSDPALVKIDKYAYIVQVEDPRGLMAIVSSFSKYSLTLNWNHMLYYTPTAILNITMIRESFESTWPPTEWPLPEKWNRYQGSRLPDGSYMAGIVGPGSGSLVTPNINCYGVTAIYVEFYYRDEGCDPGDFLLRYSSDGGRTWTTVSDLGATTNENQWLHYRHKITDNRYFTQNFKISWYANLGSGERAYVDNVTVIIALPEPPPTIVVELLQNGTMRWLGQDLQLTTQAKPIPPIPVKSIRVNQTINGVSREVPFQIEDWASDYRVPLGLASNASIFSNRNMLVFLVNPSVEKVTIWWNGSDTAVQTPYAYTNRYFVDKPPTFSNRILTLRFSSGSSAGFRITATRGSMTSTADLMRINDEDDTTDPEWWWTLSNGVVRDIVQGEPEWGKTYGAGGADRNGTCYNIYAHVVITLPANATYYTYQLRLIFLNSTDKPRTITQIRLIRITASGTFSALTENGTLPNGYPRVSGNGFFYNFSTSCWQHRWAQLSFSTRGFGVMFTDEANRILYHFDNGTIKRGALKVINSTTERAIELLPVSHERPSVINHVDPLDLCWYGAVVTFDSTMPIYRTINNVPKGLWVLVGYPPIIAVSTEE